MSTVSQTPAPTKSGLPLGFAARFAIIMGGVGLVLALALRGVLGGIVQMAAEARLHAPDWALVAAASPAVRIHLAAALSALALGAVLMTRRKGRTFHRVAGWVWVALVSVTAGSTLFITELNHGGFSFLHLFTGWVLLVLPLAVMWAKRHEVKRHRRTMMGLFYGGFAINLLIAFIPGRLLWNVWFG